MSQGQATSIILASLGDTGIAAGDFFLAPGWQLLSETTGTFQRNTRRRLIRDFYYHAETAHDAPGKDLTVSIVHKPISGGVTTVLGSLVIPNAGTDAITAETAPFLVLPDGVLWAIRYTIPEGGFTGAATEVSIGFELY